MRDKRLWNDMEWYGMEWYGMVEGKIDAINKFIYNRIMTFTVSYRIVSPFFDLLNSPTHFTSSLYPPSP